MGSIGWAMSYVGQATAYVLAIALATLVVFPPRRAWTKRSVRISLRVAVVVFICLCIPWVPFLVH